jgi:hypothetical protein
MGLSNGVNPSRMDAVMWVDLLNEGVSLLLLISLGFTFYRGFRKNQFLLTKREELLKRYLLYRGDRQVRLKIYEGNEKVYQELLKNLSTSWKNFKKTYDECLLSFGQNTHQTKFFLQLITLGLLINSGSLFVQEYFYIGFKSHFIYTVVKELSSYVLVFLSFFLLRIQTHRLLSLKRETAKLDREIFFYPNHLSGEGNQDVLYDEFDPLEATGGEDGNEDPNPHQ